MKGKNIYSSFIKKLPVNGKTKNFLMNNQIVVILIIIGLLLILWNKGYIQLPPTGNGSGEGGGSGGSGGGNSGGLEEITPSDTCAQTAKDNGYTYYKSPISTRMACSTYAFSDCSNRDKVFDSGAYNEGLKCCVWDCKDAATDGDGTDGNGADEALCSDSDGGMEIWDYGVVNVPRLTVMYPDRCKDGRWLQEWYCDSNNVARVTDVDCFTQGAICNGGKCQTPPCEQIISPDSQSDCDRGSPCLNSGEETYCKYIPATTVTTSKCVCTIEPSSINSCNRGCWFEGKAAGQCKSTAPSGTPIRNACVYYGTHYSQYDTYCPTEGFSREWCCCQ